MADKEYSLEKPARTRRIAVLGDSLVRGLGAGTGAGFEALLEERLNAVHRSSVIDRYEVLNFGVEGYRITQIVDVAALKVPPFSPDVYVVGLTDIAVFRKWGHHIAQLVHDGIDLKYPFLRQVIERSGVSARDSITTFDAKMAPFRIPVFRWALTQIRNRAEASGASMVVLLLPTVQEPSELRDNFGDAYPVLDELRVPTIDLLDAFAHTDYDALRISAENRHPNRAGYRRLSEQLYLRLLENPAAAAAVLGPPRLHGARQAPAPK
jgi:lysophospholipase L1-like esterase